MDTKKTWEEFAATWKAVMGRPEEFFATWDPAEGWQKVIVFNVICGLIGGILTAVLTFFFGIGAIIRYPLSILAMTFVGGVILFLCFKLFGGVGGVEPTIKMMGYTQAVRVFSIGVPFIGFPIGFLASLYQIWLLIVGGRAVHGLDTTRSALAVLLPAIVFGIFSLIGTLFFGVAMMTSWHMGGG